MFKKFKEKVIESQTSQRFQQITQSVSDKFQNLDKDENFFSLTEDDNAVGSSMSTQMESGFSNISLSSTPQESRNRLRRTSTSSMASDTSFIPRYDSVSSIYHLQSDLDISASEIEDNASTSSSQLGHLSKEQIYAAFQKSQMRYHKYRGRFTDLANHYKNLEREFVKLKTELEKTQERSFRRVKELKEQCELEQKAKAHLESSLRVDLDEKQIQINTLREKISFLQNNSNQNNEFEQLTKNLNEVKHENEHLNEINQEMKAKLIVLQSKDDECKEKIKKLLEDNEKLKEEERENNLKLAESKMQVHNELLSKDAELNSLQHENDSLKKTLDQYEMRSGGNTKIEQLQNQNQNLIEKVESFSQKCQKLTNDMLKIEQYKIEIQNLKTKISEEKGAHDQEIIAITKEAESFKEKLFKDKQEKEDIIDNLEKLMFNNEEIYKRKIEELKLQIENIKEEFKLQKINYEDQICKIREDAKKRLLSIEEKVEKKYEQDFNEKKLELKIEYENNLKKLISQEKDVNDFQIKLIKCEDELKKLTKEKEKFSENIQNKTEKYAELERGYIELNEDLTKERGKSSKLERELQGLKGMDEKISRLQANISTLQKENEELNTFCEEQEKNFNNLTNKNTQIVKDLEKVDEELKTLKMMKVTESREKENCKILESNIDEIMKEKIIVLNELETVKQEFVELSVMKENDWKIMREYERKLESSEEIIEQSKKREENLKTDCENFVEEKNHMEKLLRKVEEASESDKHECKILEIKLNELQEKYEEILKTNEKLIRDNLEIKKLSENLDERTSQNHNSETVEDYKKLLKEKEELEILYTELNEKLKMTEIKLENEVCEKKECKLLSTEMRELEKTYQKSIQKHEDEAKKVLKLQNTVETLKNEVEESRKILENDKKKLQDSENLIEELNENNEKNLKLLEDKDININAVTKEVEAKVQYIKNLEENYKVLNKNENDVRKELEKYKLETDKKSKDLVNLENQFADIQKLYSTEKKDIMKQLNELSQVHYSLLDENENLKEQISEIVLLQEKLKSLSEVEVEKNYLVDDLKKLKEQMKILEQENIECKKKFEGMEEVSDKYNMLEGEYNKVTEELNALRLINGEKIEVENKLDNIESSLKIYEEKYKILLEEHETLKVTSKLEKEEFNMKCQHLDEKYHKLLLEKNELVENLSLVEGEKSVLENKLEISLTDSKKLGTELGILKSEKEDLNLKTLKIESSKKELESMNEMIEKEKRDLVNEIAKFQEKLKQISKEKQELEELFSRVDNIDEKYKGVITEKEEISLNLNKLKEENEVLRQNNREITSDYKHISEENSNLITELEEVKLSNENFSDWKIEMEERVIKLNEEKEDLLTKLEKASQEIDTLKKDNYELREIKINKANTEVEFLDVQQSYYEIKTKHNELHIENKKLQNEIEDFTKNVENFKEERRKYENTINELERHQNELLNEKQLLKEEIEELKTSPLNMNNSKNIYSDKTGNLNILQYENGLDSHCDPEMNEMIEKVTQLKSLDITNKATIEFYENEVEKLRSNNEKLNRRLDETLVTLNHCSELSHSTELEYLKNVLYNYMLGKEGMVLTRVIATVCKFDDIQTEEVLKKEQQKQTLLAKLGLL